MTASMLSTMKTLQVGQQALASQSANKFTATSTHEKSFVLNAERGLTTALGRSNLSPKVLVPK